MKLSRVRAIAKKELIQVLRDPLSLAMAFLMPVILLLIFGYAITMDVNNLRTVVYDMDRSSFSRELVAQFRESGYFTVIESVERHGGIDTSLDMSRGQVALWIPAVIAVIMAVIAALLTSLTIAREWERGTMEQLISTPVKTPELIAGKLVPYFFIGFIDVALSVAMAVFLFGVPLRGSLLLLALISSIFLFGGLSLGILISVVARSQLVASQIAMVVTFLPAFLLSGFMYAIANMPLPLQNMTRVIPARYFVSVLKGIFLKGNTLGLLATETLILTLFGVVVFALANRKFKKRIV
ncbi:ABC transporter permease [Geobacter anodireducens]